MMRSLSKIHFILTLLLMITINAYGSELNIFNHLSDKQAIGFVSAPISELHYLQEAFRDFSGNTQSSTYYKDAYFPFLLSNSVGIINGEPSYNKFLTSIESPFQTDFIAVNSYIVFDRDYFNEMRLMEEIYDYYIPVTIVTDNNTSEGYVEAEELLNNESTEFTSSTVSEEVKNTVLKNGDEFVVKKVIKPFKFYLADENSKQKLLKEGMYLIKKSGSLPFNAKAADGKYYSFDNVYYCDSLEKVKQFTSGDYEVCKFGRAKRSLLIDKDHVNNIYKDSNDCFIDTKNPYTDFLKEFSKLQDGKIADANDLKEALMKKYDDSTYKRIESNLKNESKRKLGKQHKSLSIDELIEEVLKAAKEFNLDPKLLLALIDIESDFRPSAVSPVGAIGLTQIMPATGKEIAKKLGVKNYKTSMLYDPKINIRFGAEYISRLLSPVYFDGNIETALTAYNRGPGNVSKSYSDKNPIVSSNYSKSVLSGYFALNDFPNT